MAHPNDIRVFGDLDAIEKLLSRYHSTLDLRDDHTLFGRPVASLATHLFESSYHPDLKKALQVADIALGVGFNRWVSALVPLNVREEGLHIDRIGFVQATDHEEHGSALWFTNVFEIDEIVAHEPLARLVGRVRALIRDKNRRSSLDFLLDPDEELRSELDYRYAPIGYTFEDLMRLAGSLRRETIDEQIVWTSAFTFLGCRRPPALEGRVSEDPLLAALLSFHEPRGWHLVMKGDLPGLGRARRKSFERRPHIGGARIEPLTALASADAVARLRAYVDDIVAPRDPHAADHMREILSGC